MKYLVYVLLLAGSLGSLWFAGTGFGVNDRGGIYLSLRHLIPAVVVTFPVGTAGIGLWLLDPLDVGLGLVGIACVIVNPIAQIRLWEWIGYRLRPRRDGGSGVTRGSGSR